MKYKKWKYYDYFLLYFMGYIWISTIYLPIICGMEQQKADTVTSFAAAATAQAINPNFPSSIVRPRFNGQKISKLYSGVCNIGVILFYTNIALMIMISLEIHLKCKTN